MAWENDRDGDWYNMTPEQAERAAIAQTILDLAKAGDKEAERMAEDARQVFVDIDRENHVYERRRLYEKRHCITVSRADWSHAQTEAAIRYTNRLAERQKKSSAEALRA